MKYKKLIHKEYISLLENRNKSLIIATLQSENTLNDCYNKLEDLFKPLSKENLINCYNEQKFLKLISGNKKNMVYKYINSDSDSKIYGDLSGQYYIFNYMNYDFIINVSKDENLKSKNFKLYTINLSFLEKVE